MDGQPGHDYQAIMALVQFKQLVHQGIGQTNLRCLVGGWRLGVRGTLPITEPVASLGDGEPSKK